MGLLLAAAGAGWHSTARGCRLLAGTGSRAGCRAPFSPLAAAFAAGPGGPGGGGRPVTLVPSGGLSLGFLGASLPASRWAAPGQASAVFAAPGALLAKSQ